MGIRKDSFYYLKVKNRRMIMAKRPQKIRVTSILDGSTNVYDNITQASLDTGASYSSIYSCLNRYTDMCKGYVFERADDDTKASKEHLDKLAEKMEETKQTSGNRNSTSVVARNTVTGEEQVYYSISQAYRDTGVSPKFINQCLEGIIRSYKDYEFRRIDRKDVVKYTKKNNYRKDINKTDADESPVSVKIMDYPYCPIVNLWNKLDSLRDVLHSAFKMEIKIHNVIGYTELVFTHSQWEKAKDLIETYMYYVNKELGFVVRYDRG